MALVKQLETVKQMGFDIRPLTADDLRAFVTMIETDAHGLTRSVSLGDR